MHGELTGVARRWTDRMVANGGISHNPNLGSQVSGSWTKLGENVGVGYDVDGLMKAFINSPSHYRNLVDPDWTHVGVGVTFGSDGRHVHDPQLHGARWRRPRRRRPPPPPPPPPTPATRAAHRPPTTAAPAAHHHDHGAAAAEPEPTEERVTAVLEPLRSPRTGVNGRDWSR